MFGWLGRERGLIWSVVIGYLFLPEALTFPLTGLPDYDKLLAISLGVVLGSAIFFRKPSFATKLVLPPPRDMQQEISEIWADLLDMDVEDVPRDKSFLELGGSKSRMRAAVRQMIDIGVTSDVARKLYNGATVRDLVRVMPLEGPRQRAAPSLTVLSYLILTVLLFSTVMTVLTNGDPLVADVSIRPALSLQDVISMVAEPVIMMIPFLFALAFLKGQSAQLEVARAVVILGVFYAVLAGFEARMSPQLNIWVYGYFQHSWVQHLRDGFRPIVFLSHGLSVGFFLLSVVVMAFGLYRCTKDKSRILYLFAGLFVFFVLAISRNLGAFMLAAVFVPIALFAPRWVQLRVAVLTVIFFLVYPAVWQSQILPVDRFMEFVTSISEERAQTLQYRLDNEADMLVRAAERPIFGWGGWDRWRVFDEFGRDTTTADGLWVITLGERGWVGYVCFFLILTLPMFFLVRSVRRKESSHVLPAMSLIMAANLLYMIPNSTLSPIGWMIMGTVAAFVRWHLVEVDPEQQEEDAPQRSQSVYTRFERKHFRPARGNLSRQ
ncbi:MAG: hypothetical protein AAGP08_00235 [Pseudomonadota bacterium]